MVKNENIYIFKTSTFYLKNCILTRSHVCTSGSLFLPSSLWGQTQENGLTLIRKDVKDGAGVLQSGPGWILTQSSDLQTKNSHNSTTMMTWTCRFAPTAEGLAWLCSPCRSGRRPSEVASLWSRGFEPRPMECVFHRSWFLVSEAMHLSS